MITQEFCMTRFGWQPDFANIDPANENWLKDWRDALDWVRIEIDYETIKSEFIKYTKLSYSEYAEHFQKLPTWKFMSIGRVAYLLNRNATCTQPVMDVFLAGVQELMATEISAGEVTDQAVEPITAKAKKSWDYVSLYSYIEAIVYQKLPADKLEDVLTKRLRTVEPSKQLLKKLYLHFKESLTDTLNAKAVGNTILDADLLVSVINVLAQQSGNAKVSTKSSTKVSKSAQKTTAKVAYKTIDSTTNVASIGPEQIPGTSIALIYNAKTRKIMVYCAPKSETLVVKGTKIVGFDESTSYAKILRKPKEILSSLQLAQNSKRVKLVLDQNVRGKVHPVNGRISKDMLIVKVFK